MTCRGIFLTIAVLVIVANCTCLSANPVNQIDDRVLREYSVRELSRGAQSLGVSSRVLYREALELLERGDWEKAKDKLLLSASLAGDYPDPLFTLARIEFMHAESDFVFHLFDGLVRLIGGYQSQAILAINAAVLLVISLFGALLVTLVVLLIKYWALFDHWLRERYSKKFSFPPEQWIGIILLISLLVTRVGLALYIAVLLIILWTFMSRKEKGVVLTLVILLSAGSFTAHYSNIFAPAIDPYSITRRLSLIDERGVDGRLIARIAEIEDPEYKAERDYAIGTLLYRLGIYDEAKRYLLDAVSDRPDFSPAYLNLGNVYFVQNDFDKALAGYQNTVAIDPENAIAHYNIGQAFIQKMLFAQSSQSLKKATDLGIENYKLSHPLVHLRETPIFDQGFDNAMLWKISSRESSGRDETLLGEILKPYLLVPFKWFGILLIASAIAAIILSSRFARSWNVFRCDNCSQATCPECVNDETGIMLCRNCSDVIQSLSSVKVMEALLRHRRQKVSGKQNKNKTWRLSFFPGALFIYHGMTLKGVFLAFVNAGLVTILLRKGFYFKDPKILILAASLWKLIIPAVLLLLGYLASFGLKVPQEQKNYRILPPDYVAENKESEIEATETDSDGSPVPTGSYLDI